MDSEAMKKGLFAVGVPARAAQTTLVLEGQQALRDSIKGRDAEAGTGYVVYPATDKYAAKARTVFYTLAKECFLLRNRVCVVNLTRAVDALLTDGYPAVMDCMSESRMLFITDFYEYGAPSPFSGADGARFRGFVKGYIESGRAVSVLSDRPLPSCKDWYPASFLELLSGHTEAFVVDKGEA